MKISNGEIIISMQDLVIIEPLLTKHVQDCLEKPVPAWFYTLATLQEQAQHTMSVLGLVAR